MTDRERADGGSSNVAPGDPALTGETDGGLAEWSPGAIPADPDSTESYRAAGESLVSAVFAALRRGDIDETEAEQRLQSGFDELCADVAERAADDPTPDRVLELVGAMSHDIRNPLGVVQRDVALVKDDIHDARRERIDRNLTRIEDIVNDVMTLSRHADSDVETESVDLQHVATLAWGAVSTGSAFVETEPVVLDADESQLHRVLENLFRNAVEHGSSTHGSEGRGDETPVTVRVGPLVETEGFYVADDGPGIPESNRDRVFEHGFSTTENGTGFGLSIVRAIVDNHGWEITVTESEDGSARFEIRTGNASTC